MAEQRTGRGRTGLALRLAGLAAVAAAAISIGHFVYHAATAGFPPQVLGVAFNWLFIGAHALVGAAGLVLLGLGARARLAGLAAPPVEATGAEPGEESR
ncbi:MAG: hypothetical protein R6V85_12745 [Polyangia bacterium]